VLLRQREHDTSRAATATPLKLLASAKAAMANARRDYDAHCGICYYADAVSLTSLCN